MKDPPTTVSTCSPGAADDAYTVTEQVGGAVARRRRTATVSFTASGRAVRAVDGDPTTAWQVGAFEGVDGEFLSSPSPSR